MWRIGLISVVAALFLGIAPRSQALSPPGLNGDLGNYVFRAETGAPGAPLTAGGASVRVYVGPLKWQDAGCGGGAGMAVSPAWATAESSDSRVFTVESAAGNQVQLTTGAPGVATLILLAADGTPVERARFEVRATTNVRESQASTVLLEGSTIAVCYKTLAGRVETVGKPTLRFVADGGLSIVPAPEGESTPCSGDHVVWLKGRAGTGHLTITDGIGFSLVRDWLVVSAAEVSRIALEANTPRSADGSAAVFARAEIPGGFQVLGPRCAWSAVDPAVVIEPWTISGGRIETDAAGLRMPAKGSYEVRCTIGTAVASTVVQYQ